MLGEGFFLAVLNYWSNDVYCLKVYCVGSKFFSLLNAVKLDETSLSRIRFFSMKMKHRDSLFRCIAEQHSVALVQRLS